MMATELFTSGIDFLEIYDGDHSGEEYRFIAVGPIHAGLVVVVTPNPRTTSSAS